MDGILVKYFCVSYHVCHDAAFHREGCESGEEKIDWTPAMQYCLLW